MGFWNGEVVNMLMNYFYEICLCFELVLLGKKKKFYCVLFLYYFVGKIEYVFLFYGLFLCYGS